VRSPYLDNDFNKTVYRAPQAAADVRLRLIADRSPALAALKTDRGVGGGPVYSGISKAYQEFTYKAEYAYDYGMPHALARADRRLSALGLERLFLGRHKAFHFRRWYRRELSQYVREMLLDSRTLSRPYLQRRSVEAMVAAHVSGDGNYTTELHKVLGLELLHRLFFDAR
jgi:asparagine synthase (glutamine-hydrolysing)